MTPAIWTASMALGLSWTAAGAAPLEPFAMRCTVLRTCDARGACERGAGLHTFRATLLDSRGDGSGRYRLEVDGEIFEAETVSELGPLLWQEGRRDLQTLLITGDSEVLWHRMRYGAQIGSRILFLTCEDLP